jgi:hypothetical protein
MAFSLGAEELNREVPDFEGIRVFSVKFWKTHELGVKRSEAVVLVSCFEISRLREETTGVGMK